MKVAAREMTASLPKVTAILMLGMAAACTSVDRDRAETADPAAAANAEPASSAQADSAAKRTNATSSIYDRVGVCNQSSLGGSGIGGGLSTGTGCGGWQPSRQSSLGQQQRGRTTSTTTVDNTNEVVQDQWGETSQGPQLPGGVQ